MARVDNCPGRHQGEQTVLVHSPPTDEVAAADGSVIILASNAVVRCGLRAIFDDAGWGVAAGDGPVLRQAVVRQSVVIWDASAGDELRDIESVVRRYAGIPIVAMVAAHRGGNPADLLSMGVSGVVDRDLDVESLVQAVRSVREGRTVINTGVIAGVRGDAPIGRPPRLTRRESQVLGLLGEGRANREIAEALVISENTVKNHVRRLYEKLQVRSRTEAVVTGVRWGLVTLVVQGDRPVSR